jgi:heme-degrading monooxygenase HmoA
MTFSLFAIPWVRVDRSYVGPVVVQGTNVELRRIRDVPAFVVMSMRIHRQVRRSPGAVGVALLSRPWQMRFVSVSAWRSEEDLRAFVRDPIHVAAMRRFALSGRRPGRFPSWAAHTSDLPIRWRTVFARVAEAEPHRSAARSEDRAEAA